MGSLPLHLQGTQFSLMLPGHKEGSVSSSPPVCPPYWQSCWSCRGPSGGSRDLTFHNLVLFTRSTKLLCYSGFLQLGSWKTKKWAVHSIWKWGWQQEEQRSNEAYGLHSPKAAPYQHVSQHYFCKCYGPRDWRTLPFVWWSQRCKCHGFTFKTLCAWWILKKIIIKKKIKMLKSWKSTDISRSLLSESAFHVNLHVMF